MSSPNPYSVPDDELDLGKPKPKRERQKHSLDGKPCPACNGVSHDVRGDDLPPEVMDKVSELLDDLPPGTFKTEIVVARAEPHKLMLISEFAQFAHQINDLTSQWPLLRAVAEVLDTMTEGAVGRKWKLYGAEQDVQISHLLMKTANLISDALTNDNDPQVQKLLDSLVQSSLNRVHGSVEVYRKRCAENDIEPDSQLEETGVADPERLSKFGDHAFHATAQDIHRMIPRHRHYNDDQ